LTDINRNRFYFTEGVCELVSGFNVEYSVGRFPLIFMEEYA